MQPLKEREEELYRSFQSLCEQNIGDKEVHAANDSAIGKEISERINELFDDFPTSLCGNRFVKSTFSVHPTIKVRYPDLQPLLAPEGGLFRTQTGCWITIPVLKDKTFGTFTEEPLKLEITNLHFPEDATFTSNEWTEERIRQLSNSSVINGIVRIGEVTIDPSLKKTEIEADIKIGSFSCHQKIEAQTDDDETLELIIHLDHLTLTGAIDTSGEVELPNHVSVSVDDLTGAKDENWIGVNHEVSLEFTIQGP